MWLRRTAYAAKLQRCEAMTRRRKGKQKSAARSVLGNFSVPQARVKKIRHFLEKHSRLAGFGASGHAGERHKARAFLASSPSPYGACADYPLPCPWIEESGRDVRPLRGKERECYPQQPKESPFFSGSLPLDRLPQRPRLR